MPPPSSRSLLLHYSQRRRSRSSSPRRSLPEPEHSVTTSNSIYFTPPASANRLASRRSSRPGMPEPDWSAGVGPYQSNSINPQDVAACFLGDLRGPALVPQSVTSPSAVTYGAHPHLQPQLGPHITGFPQLPPQNHGTFSQAHDFTMTRPMFIDGNVTFNNATSSRFMEKLLGKTIPGAAFNSSARDPPPRCHPGTRVAILERCIDFITNCDGVRKIRWVVGAAGVGKSAILQNVTESPDLPVTFHASVFFSVIGRHDVTKAVITISYQFATRSEAYRQLVEDEIARDPSLLDSAMAVQFNKLIAEPFAHHPHLNSAGRVLIVIDGLDECNNSRTQQELLRLIAEFCITYPSSPIVWLIASRPEPHITSFFSRRNIMPAYEKEEITVNSDEARADVERYLRDQLTEIKEASDSLDPEWPGERNLRKLAHAAGGLFAYAHTVVRYISDSTIGSPASQLSGVLHVIDRHPMLDVAGEEHPLALLDALYARILSNIPSKVMINTRKLLLTLASRWDGYLWPFLWPGNSLVLLCNWLHMTPEEAYAALNHLRSVLHVPTRCKAHEEGLIPFHKSFIDYLSDFTRSGFSRNIQDEFQQINVQSTLRILKEAHGGIDVCDMAYETTYSILTCDPSTGLRVSLTWPAHDDEVTKFNMYQLAIAEFIAGTIRGVPTFQGGFSIQLLIALFLRPRYPFARRHQLRDLVFVESRRDEFMRRGILKQVPLNMVHTPRVLYGVKLQFRRPDTTMTNLSDPWDLSCNHIREGEWEEGKDQNWVTSFRMGRCTCSRRLQHQIESLKIRSPDFTVLVLFTTTEHCCIEFRLVDLEDGMSEWKYWFWYMLTWGEYKKYGDVVRHII